MKVVDLSDWNDHVNWSHLKDKGVEGAIVKISEGRTITELGGKHIAAAVARGLPWGVYCYTHAETVERAQEEAEAVISALHALQYGVPPLDIWFDIEDAAVLSHDKETITAICSKFISTCNGAGYGAGIYASLYTFIDHIAVSELADYVPYWCAQYAWACEFADYFPKARLQGWQYTDGYVIDGVCYDMSEWY